MLIVFISIEISQLLSVEQSSSIITSKFLYVWLRTLSMRSSKYLAWLQLGMITLTNGFFMLFSDF